MNIKNIENIEGLVITKGGFLYLRRWVRPIFDEESDEVIEEGYYKIEDVSEELPVFLYESCELEEGLTLRDLFKLCDKHRAFLSIILMRYYFLEFLEHGLNAPQSKVQSADQDSENYTNEVVFFDLSTGIHNECEYIYDEERKITLTTLETDKKQEVTVHSKGDKTESSINSSRSFSYVTINFSAENSDSIEQFPQYPAGEVTLYDNIGGLLWESMVIHPFLVH